jgi:hypothetical protein
MPVKRRQAKKREEVSPEQDAWLHGHDRPAGFFAFLPKEELAAFWDEHRDRLIDEHVERWPGTRPSRWWEYDSPRIPLGTFPDSVWDGQLPEPRKRIGGTGTASHECLAHLPRCSDGLPISWVSQRDVEYYTGTARAIDGNLANPKPSGTFKGVAIDPNDPPTYESQAAYLERHQLFLPGERRRLTRKDFESEKISLSYDVESAA